MLRAPHASLITKPDGMCEPHCSCCLRNTLPLVQVMVELTAASGKQHYNRYCLKCVRAFGSAKVVGKEIRRKLGEVGTVILKRWRAGNEASPMDRCFHHPRRGYKGEMVAAWLGQAASNVCAPCVEAMVATAARVPPSRRGPSA
jgi:hypothetical protein